MHLLANACTVISPPPGLSWVQSGALTGELLPYGHYGAFDIMQGVSNPQLAACRNSLPALCLFYVAVPGAEKILNNNIPHIKSPGGGNTLLLLLLLSNFVMDRVAQKARPANVLPHKHTKHTYHIIIFFIII